MTKQTIQAYLKAETHLEGNFIKYLPKGQIMIHCGPKKQPKQGAKVGVAVILSPKLEQGWKKHENIITY